MTFNLKIFLTVWLILSFFKNNSKLLLLFLIVLIIGYALKSLIGINIFPTFSLSSSFPLKYLKNDVIRSTKPFIILKENFNRMKLYKNFGGLWKKGKGIIKKDISPDGFSGSRCLRIESIGNKSWGYLHKKRVEVQIGDQFYMEGLTKLSGNDISAFLNIAAFNQNNEIIYFCRNGSNVTGKWTKIIKQFNITDNNIRYIRFSIIGMGDGEFRFDNILFRKLNLSD